VNNYLVGYDVPGIQRYVFETVRPLDIAGGSALLERFASEAGAIAAACGAETIYSAGGGGLFVAPDEPTAGRLSEDFRKTVEGLTKGGASVVCASVDFDSDFRDARERLRRRLGDERLAQLIDRPSDVLLPSGTRPKEVCEACGLEVADPNRESPVGSGAEEEPEKIGARCQARRDEGRRRRQATGVPETIRDLFPPEEEDDARGPERLPRGAVLAALYLDGDGLGRRLAEIADPHELRYVSTAVTEGVKHVLQSIGGNGGRDGATILAPVVGGDDVLVFCDARRAAALLNDLWSALDNKVRLGGEPVRFSAAIVLSDPYLPLRLLFDEAKRGLERAKERSGKAATAHVELRTLLGRRLHGGRGTSLAGAPLPRSQFWGGSPSFRTLVESVSKVGRAQRSGIADDLSEPSVELRDLLLDERAARERKPGEPDSDSLLRVLEEARSLGQACGAASHDLLGAALAVVPLWGDRR
jgi:hypothetical protein